MVIAPHADDETLGCGGLLAKYPDTHVTIVAAPLMDRVFEWQRAAAELQLSGAYDIGQFQDGNVGADQRRLVGFLDEQLGAYSPDELYLPAPGTHQDHVAVYEAGMRAARLSMSRDHWFPPTVLLYDVPAYDLELYPTQLRFTTYEALTPVQVQRKAKAMACYDSQVPHDEHPAGEQQVVATARLAGSEVGVMFAEKYSTVRMVRA